MRVPFLQKSFDFFSPSLPRRHENDTMDAPFLRSMGGDGRTPPVVPPWQGGRETGDGVRIGGRKWDNLSLEWVLGKIFKKTMGWRLLQVMNAPTLAVLNSNVVGGMDNGKTEVQVLSM